LKILVAHKLGKRGYFMVTNLDDEGTYVFESAADKKLFETMARLIGVDVKNPKDSAEYQPYRSKLPIYFFKMDVPEKFVDILSWAAKLKGKRFSWLKKVKSLDEVEFELMCELIAKA